MNQPSIPPILSWFSSFRPGGARGCGTTNPEAAATDEKRANVGYVCFDMFHTAKSWWILPNSDVLFNWVGCQTSCKRGPQCFYSWRCHSLWPRSKPRLAQYLSVWGTCPGAPLAPGTTAPIKGNNLGEDLFGEFSFFSLVIFFDFGLCLFPLVFAMCWYWHHWFCMVFKGCF